MRIVPIQGFHVLLVLPEVVKFTGQERYIVLFIFYFQFHLSDPTVKQFLLHMDETRALGEKFILEDMDATHLFVAAKIVKTLEAKLWELMDKLSFPVGDGQ